MVPSSASIANPNITLNTIVAEVLSVIADRLEKATDFNSEVQNIIKEIATKNMKVIFNGNNYSNEWVTEAEKRGLPNITNSVDAIATIIDEKNIKVFEKHNILTKKEIESRYEISLEHYNKTINIEALTMIDMSKRQILPACINYMTTLADSINSINLTSAKLDLSAQTDLLEEISSITASFSKNIAKLEQNVSIAQGMHNDSLAQAKFYRDSVFSQMALLRIDGDKLETLVAEDFWPFPTYQDILYSI